MIILAGLIGASTTNTAPSIQAAPRAAANGLGQTPIMGWSSWSLQSSTRSGYGKNWLTAQNIKNHSDYMQQKLQSAGYTYLNIDSGWNADLNWTFQFDGNGIPRPDATRFPSGIVDLANYVHAKGQKLGCTPWLGWRRRCTTPTIRSWAPTVARGISPSNR
jgi:hypothetical protein